LNGITINITLDQHARRRVAGLAGVVEAVQRAALYGLLVGIRKFDVGALAAQLQVDALERVRIFSMTS
jgi:hypothetical protein